MIGIVLMSTIQKRSNNTYTITVSLGYGADGKQIRRTKTIEVDSKLTPKQTEKYVQQEAALFEAGAGKELQERKRGSVFFTRGGRTRLHGLFSICPHITASVNADESKRW